MSISDLESIFTGTFRNMRINSVLHVTMQNSQHSSAQQAGRAGGFYLHRSPRQLTSRALTHYLRLWEGLHLLSFF